MDLGLDSLAILELVVLIEEEFDISIADEDLSGENFNTVGTLLDMVNKYLKVANCSLLIHRLFLPVYLLALGFGLDTLRKLLTCHVRGDRFQDRFQDGMLESIVADGTLRSILSRLQVIRDELALNDE